MPDEKTLERARRDLREGKSPGTAAGEFVREEMHHLRDGTHGVSSPEQSIAIGLSKARRAGILPGEEPPRRAKTRRPASPDEDAASPAPDATSRAKRRAVNKPQPRKRARATTPTKPARRATTKRTAAERSASARKGARTRARNAKARRGA
jgi:hypothetical protein